MSAASQILFHPYINASLKVASTTVGRDKAYRTVQYFSRFLAFYTYRKGYTKDTIARFSNLKSALGSARKLMRIGKFMEHFQAAAKGMQIGDPILRATAIGRQIGYGIYLVNDSLIWLHGAKVKVFEPDTIARINKRAAQFWMTGILFSIVSGLYRLRDLQAREARARKVRPTPEKEADRKTELKGVLSAVRLQLVQDSLDVLIPATTLGYTRLDEGTVGLAGFVTSLLGLRAQCAKVLGPASK